MSKQFWKDESTPSLVGLVCICWAGRENGCNYSERLLDWTVAILGWTPMPVMQQFVQKVKSSSRSGSKCESDVVHPLLAAVPPALHLSNLQDPCSLNPTNCTALGVKSLKFPQNKCSFKETEDQWQTKTSVSNIQKVENLPSVGNGSGCYTSVGYQHESESLTAQIFGRTQQSVKVYSGL